MHKIHRIANIEAGHLCIQCEWSSFSLNWSDSMTLAGEWREYGFMHGRKHKARNRHGFTEREAIGFDWSDAANEYRLWSYHNLPLRVNEVLNFGLMWPGVPPEQSRTTKAHILPSCSNNRMAAFDLAGKLRDTEGIYPCGSDLIAQLDRVWYYSAARVDGKMRSEGKDYVLNNGDVVLIKRR